jgi:hypothetical protein
MDDTTDAKLKLKTKGIRPRPDQIQALGRLMELDPELNWSKAVRRGLDLFIAERTTAQANQAVAAGLYLGKPFAAGAGSMAFATRQQRRHPRAKPDKSRRRADSKSRRTHST